MKFTNVIINAAIAFASINSASAKLGWAGQTFDEAEAQRLERMSFNERLLQLVKTLWPECIDKDAFWCKNLIDSELAQLTFDRAEEIYSVIVYRRKNDSPTNNAFVIPVDDNDLVIGRDGDGLLHYDWEWCGRGSKLTTTAEIEASSKLIKPSKWTKMIEKNPNVECVDGVVVHQKSVNAFGGDFNPNACSTLEGYTKYQELLSETVPMPPAGCRKLDAIDASGMSGMDACELVKHLVPDANVDGKQIECWIQYAPGTVKLQETKTETKVVIFAKVEDNKVIGTPRMNEGSDGPFLPN
jgi:hypothetical protein